jgi:ATP-binding cassette subfamily B (MDR/TAP) protein 1
MCLIFRTSPESTLVMSFTYKSRLALVYLFLGKFTLCYIAMYAFRVTGIHISAAIRLAYLRALFSQSIGRLDRLPPGQAANTITTSSNLLQNGISEKLSTCIQFTTLLITAYVIAFVYSWQLTLVASSILVFCILVFGTIIPLSIRFQKSFDHANDKASSIASEVFSSIRMVVACGAERRVFDSYSKWVDEARRRGLKLSPVIGTQMAPLFFGVYGDFAITFWYGVKLFREHRIDNVQAVIM